MSMEGPIVRQPCRAHLLLTSRLEAIRKYVLMLVFLCASWTTAAFSVQQSSQLPHPACILPRRQECIRNFDV